MNFNIHSIITSSRFDPSYIERGRQYYQQGKVLSCNIKNASDSRVIIKSEIQGSQNKNYRANIIFNLKNNKILSFTSSCSCPVAHNCKHVVATLLQIDDENNTKQQETEVSNKIKQWLLDMQSELQTTRLDDKVSSKKNTIQNKCILYILDYKLSSYTKQKQLHINLQISSVLKKGGFGVAKQFEYYLDSHTEALNEDDHNIFTMFMLNHQVLDFRNIRGYHTRSLFLHNKNLGKLIELLVKTKRCFWQKTSNQPLNIGQQVIADFDWSLQPDASQKFNIATGSAYSNILFLDKPWLLSEDYSTLQPLILTDENNNKLPDNLASKLLQAPSIPARDAQLVQKQLQSVFGENNKVTRIKSFDNHQEITVSSIRPQAHFNITEFEVEIFDEIEIMTEAAIELSFNYDNINVPYKKDSLSNNKITCIKDDVIYSMQRDRNIEQQYFNELSGAFKLQHAYDNTFVLIDYDINEPEDIYNLLAKYRATKPKLLASGWTITAGSDIFYDIIDEDDASIEWYANLNDSDYNYFEYSFGVKIDNEEINLLPAIVEIIQNNTDLNSVNINDNTKVPIVLKNQKILAVKYKRLKPIVDTIYELYSMGQKLTESDSLKLSKQRAALLHEMAQAFKLAKMRWHGSEQLLELSAKLKNFNSIKKASPPKKLNARLRDYQQQGLSWLQFLNEFQLSGILADDMGLGKTIQVLASIQLDKEHNKLEGPCLIIAPTSLVSNWKSEAEKFCPDLKVLDYHGDNRKARLLDANNNINDYDIIISTYGLLIHEKDFFMAHEFYHLILDEAQNIKNHQAKTTLIAQQIKSKHRLCLTGTPVENNLDELWSLFNFIMPGFLGNNKQFRQIFGTPIEKHKDNAKKKYLAQRIKPFILRRTKSEVIKDLPPKTDVVHKIEIDGAQRELYETIRLAMEQKVQKVISDKGLNKSHIMILDALLKLRQVCCDPRILNIESSLKDTCTSAKLIELENMLVTCVQENRKVIVFSQFVTMLKLIEQDIIKKHGYKYSKITGESKNRAEQVSQFQEGDSQIFLISLKAGGTGLNLTAADTVIHFDPWWNPAVEDQATDRAYRIGQDKPIFVYKLIIAGSVEETILKMQDKKRGIIDGLFSDANNNHEKLTNADISSLFAPLET